MKHLRKLFTTFITRFQITAELMSFLWQHKLWWIMPVILFILILMVLILFGQSTGIVPFLYPFF